MAGSRTPRVVVSVGTDKHPFDRLIEWVEHWVVDHRDVGVFIQYGTSAAPALTPGATQTHHADLVDMIASADVVISHGGPSTVMDVRANGRLPIVVPRNPQFGEHVDDHQMRFADHLNKHGMALLAKSEDELHSLIDQGLAEPAKLRLSLDGHGVPAGIVAFEKHMNALLDIHPEAAR